MTFADRLAAEGNRDLRFLVTIQGINHAFEDASVDVTSALLASTRTKVRCLVDFTLDRRELDILARRQKGGALTLQILDDETHVLRKLFAPRKDRATFVTSSQLATDTTINVKSTVFMPSAGDVWIGGETINYTSVTTTSLLGCTRGAYGSIAKPMRGSSTDGQGVYTTPSSWRGRTLTLTGYFLKRDGSQQDDATMSQVLGTFEIDQAPVWKGDDVWEIKAVDRLDTHLRRALYLGVHPIEGSILEVANFGAGPVTAQVNVPDAAMVAVAGSNAETTGAAPNNFGAALIERTRDVDNLLVWDVGRITHITKAADGASSLGVLDLDFPNQHALIAVSAPTWNPGASATTFSGKIAPVSVLEDSADSVLLKLLTSRIGDGSNGADDVLWGLDPTSYDDNAWRMGAGILRADVDTTAVQAVGRSFTWFWLLQEPLTAADVIAEFCFLTETFAKSNASGQLSFQTLSPTSTTIATIDANSVQGKASVEYDEGSVYPHIVVKSGYAPRTQNFCALVEINDAETAERFPTTDETLTIALRSMYVGGFTGEGTGFCFPTVSVGEVETRARRYMADELRVGGCFVTVKAHLDFATLDIGDLVHVTLPEVPDLEGNTLASRLARIVGVLPHWKQGFVEIRLQVFKSVGRKISPAAVITNASGAVMTLSTAAPEAPADGKPGQMLGSNTVNMGVLVCDASAGIAEPHSIVSFDDTHVTLDSAPSFTVQVGEDFITLMDAASTSGAQTAHGFSDADDFIFQIDDDESTNAQIQTRWR